MKKIILSALLVFTSAIAAMASGHTVGISSQNNVACTGSATGSVTVTVSGGVGSFSYSWAPGGETTASISGLTAGTYTVTVTDQNDLSTANTIVAITQPASQLTANASASPSTICVGGSGTINVTAVGGTPVYTYTWNPSGAFTNSPTYAPIVTTTYTCTVMDANGCTATASATITVNSKPIVSITGVTTICQGTSTTLTATGGGTYSWDTGAITAAISVTPNYSATYTVTVTDGNSCTNSTSVMVNVSTKFPHAIFSTAAACGGADGSLEASGGGLPFTSGYSYNWQPTGGTSYIANGLTSGTYTLTVIDQTGCTFISTATVPVLGAGAITGVTVSDSIYNQTCLGIYDGAIDITVTGSNPGPFTYQWSNGQTTQDILNLGPYNYRLIVYDPSMKCFSSYYQVYTDGTACGSMTGTIFSDPNFDCINNSGNTGLNNIMVIANPGNYMAFTNTQGYYYFNNIPFGTYTLTQKINNPYTFATCSSSLNANLNGGNNNIYGLDFADTVAAFTKDISVITTTSGVIPGFVTSAYAILNNYTSVLSSGKVSLILPIGFGSLISSGTPGGYIVNGDTVSWLYTNLFYGSSHYYVNFTTPVGTPLGTVFNFCAYATVTGGDINPLNNNYCSQHIARASYDPNDKTVSPLGNGPQGDIALSDITLDYHIRFQNTGNGPAVNIVVKDTLSDKLDINTLEVTGASHDYIIDVMDGNILRWKFNNIMLADSGSNEPASHGWIDYRIKQKSSNQIGDQIKNTAYIYFDFNEAVVTNTILNTIATPTDIEETVSSNNTIKVFPNPFTDNTTFIIQSDKLNETYSFELSDVLGKQVISIKEITKEFQISRNGLPNGIYFYKIYSDENIVGVGKLIIR